MKNTEILFQRSKYVTLETQVADITFSRLCKEMPFLIVDVIRQW